MRTETAAPTASRGPLPSIARGLRAQAVALPWALNPLPGPHACHSAPGPSSPLVLSGPLCVRLRRFRKVATASPPPRAQDPRAEASACPDTRVTCDQRAVTSATSAVEQEPPPPASNPALGRPPVASLAEGPTLKILALAVASVVCRAAPGQRQRHPRTGRSRCSTAASARPSGSRPGTALPGAARRTSPDPRPGCRDRRRRGRHDHTDRDPDLGDLGQHRQPADEQLVRHLDSGQHRPEPQHLRFRDRIPRRGPGNRQCRRRPGVSVHHLRQRPQQRAGAVPRR